MKLIQKYIDYNLKKGGYVYLNNSIKGEILKNVKCLSFSKLYARIILLFYKEALIDIPEDDALKVEYYLSLTKLDDNAKMFINGYYARYDFNSQNKISSYCYLMLEDIVKKNNNIIYADTDGVYYTGDKIDLFDIDIPVNEIEEFDYISFIRIKCYVSHSKKTNEFKINGIRNTSTDKYKSEIKQEIRNDKLEVILS